MNAKEYLQQLDKIDFLIESKKNEIEQLRAKLFSGIAYENDGSKKSSSDVNKNEKIIIKIIELEEEMNEQLGELIDMKKEIIKVVDQLKDSDEIKVIYLRYFQQYRWSRIQIELNYSKSHIMRIHFQAIKDLDEILENLGQNET